MPPPLDGFTAENEERHTTNPLTVPYPWWHELYHRIKLIPWWFSYNLGIAREAMLKDKIIELATSMGLEEKWARAVVRHAVSEFSKKGLGPDYYGYHTIDHELEATFFALLAAKESLKLGYDDTRYLFVSALFHDFDPLKEFDKPNEESVERFLRRDQRIQRFMLDIGINPDIAISLIYRTAYPFEGKIKERALKRMHELFESAGITVNSPEARKYEELGWFLSVAERVAGYALGDFARACELARRNAHALGWHPSVINIESVKYFEVLEGEKEMVERMLVGIPPEYKKRFYENVAAFRQEWEKEKDTREHVRKKQLVLVPTVEPVGYKPDPDLVTTLLRLHRMLAPPIRVEESFFRESLMRRDTLLVTLRINDINGPVVGYAKGGPLEHYHLRHGTRDENIGRRNTVFIEPMSIGPGYWGAGGGHILRMTFLHEALKRGYQFASSYTHRNVIEYRGSRGEPIEIVCKYDPDRLDYYRLKLHKLPPDYLVPIRPETPRDVFDD